MSLSINDTIDTAFSCIQSGNELESQGKLWEAAVQFQQAHRVLDGLAGQDVAPAGKGEDPKVVDLYRQQAREYFFRSRVALLSAMQVENDHDQQGSDNGLVRSTLNPKDLDSRISLFGHLYARVPLSASADAAAAAASTSEEETLSEQTLQERLMQLNENLPSGFKTTEQRMADINRGLNRLGMSSIYTTTSNSAVTNLNLEVTAKSESEQVDEIIQQARDEVRFATVNPIAPNATTPTSHSAAGAIAYSTDSDDPDRDDDSESVGEDDDDKVEESEEEIELTCEQILSLREDMVLAQAEIAQLLVLLDLDEGGDAEIEFEQQAGLGHLRRARKALRHAAHEWKVKKN